MVSTAIVSHVQNMFIGRAEWSADRNSRFCSGATRSSSGSSSDPHVLSYLTLPPNVLALILTKIGQPLGAYRLVSKAWKSTADVNVLNGYQASLRALDLLIKLCPSIDTLDLSAFCFPVSSLHLLLQLQHLQHLSLHCWPSTAMACLTVISYLPMLASLSLSSPCQHAEAQLAFRKPPASL